MTMPRGPVPWLLATYATVFLVIGLLLITDARGYHASVYELVVFELIPRLAWGIAFAAQGLFILAAGVAHRRGRIQARGTTFAAVAATTAALCAFWAWWLIVGWWQGLTGPSNALSWVLVASAIVISARVPEVHDA